jgi:poly-D-alanine transfer protein DltD
MSINGNEQPNDMVHMKHLNSPDYTDLQALLEALHELISWTRMDSKDNGFSIVDDTWPIYKSLSACYNNYHVKSILEANGISIRIDDMEDHMPIYEISYTS